MKTRYWTWLGWPLGAVPLACLVLEAASGQLGPDPAEVFVERLGWWALVLLLTCLAMRPAAQLLRVPGLVVWRRTFGLLAVGYVSLHFLAWATLLLGWDPNYLGEELGKRPYIIVGLLGWLAMWPLAATSTRKARRRMGARWGKLHRLVFPAVILGVVHQSWVQKSGYGETLIFALVLAMLLIYRGLKDHRLSNK